MLSQASQGKTHFKRYFVSESLKREDNGESFDACDSVLLGPSIIQRQYNDASLSSSELEGCWSSCY